MSEFLGLAILAGVLMMWYDAGYKAITRKPVGPFGSLMSAMAPAAGRVVGGTASVFAVLAVIGLAIVVAGILLRLVLAVATF